MTTYPQDCPAIGEIRDRIIRLKDLLRAADQLCDAVTDAQGPLFAVLQASLTEARQLDSRFADLFDPESVA